MKKESKILEFKKFLNKSEFLSTAKKNPNWLFKNLYKTLKKGTCGNKSCSKGSDGSYYDYEDGYSNYSNDNVIEIKLKDNIFKCYFYNEKNIIVLEKEFNKLIANENDIKEINDYFEKNKLFILERINRETNNFKYKKFKITGKKIFVYYDLI